MTDLRDDKCHQDGFRWITRNQIITGQFATRTLTLRNNKMPILLSYINKKKEKCGKGEYLHLHLPSGFLLVIDEDASTGLKMDNTSNQNQT